MSVCGNQWQKWGGIHTTFFQWWKVSRCKQWHRHNWTTLSQVGVWGDEGKLQQDMTFLLIVPSITMGYERVFNLVVVWVHSCQAHCHSLEEAACKLALLVDESVDWAYTFVWLDEALSHVPLLSEGGTCQCHDRWCAQCRHLGPAPLAADSQTIATQGCSGMPRRFEWQTWSLAVYLPGAATLECCCTWQTCP